MRRIKVPTDDRVQKQRIAQLLELGVRIIEYARRRLDRVNGYVTYRIFDRGVEMIKDALLRGEPGRQGRVISDITLAMAIVKKVDEGCRNDPKIGNMCSRIQDAELRNLVSELVGFGGSEATGFQVLRGVLGRRTVVIKLGGKTLLPELTEKMMPQIIDEAKSGARIVLVVSAIGRKTSELWDELTRRGITIHDYLRDATNPVDRLERLREFVRHLDDTLASGERESVRLIAAELEVRSGKPGNVEYIGPSDERWPIWTASKDELLQLDSRGNVTLNGQVVVSAKGEILQDFTVRERSDGSQERVIFGVDIDHEKTGRMIRSHIIPLLNHGKIVVIPGFIGTYVADKGPLVAHGRGLVTLGTNGSDITAAEIATCVAELEDKHSDRLAERFTIFTKIKWIQDELRKENRENGYSNLRARMASLENRLRAIGRVNETELEILYNRFMEHVRGNEEARKQFMQLRQEYLSAIKEGRQDAERHATRLRSFIRSALTPSVELVYVKDTGGIVANFGESEGGSVVPQMSISELENEVKRVVESGGRAVIEPKAVQIMRSLFELSDGVIPSVSVVHPYALFSKSKEYPGTKIVC
ncbi:MAG: hypothetical protein QXP42_04580 [Candidatus Micrarchaeia archaeon]